MSSRLFRRKARVFVHMGIFSIQQPRPTENEEPRRRSIVSGYGRRRGELSYVITRKKCVSPGAAARCGYLLTLKSTLSAIPVRCLG